MVVDLGCGKGADLAPIAQHGHALGDLDHLLQAMTDEHDRDALRLQPAHRRQQQVDLMPRQRRRGFVHEQEARVGGQPAADRDDLALRDRQVADRRIERQVRIEPCERGQRGFPHGAAGRRLERAAELMVDRNVLQHGQVGEQRQVLEDDLDAERLGLVRRQLLMGHPVDRDRAAWIGRMNAGQDLDQGRFAGAVLPHQAVDLARLDRPVDGIERNRSAEALSDAGKRQERLRTGLWNGSSDRHSSLS